MPDFVTQEMRFQEILCVLSLTTKPHDLFMVLPIDIIFTMHTTEIISQISPPHLHFKFDLASARGNFAVDNSGRKYAPLFASKLL